MQSTVAAESKLLIYHPQGIYPTLIILLVVHQRSTPDTVFTGPSEFPMSLEPMRFKEASITRKSQKRPDDLLSFTETDMGESSGSGQETV